MSGSSFELPPSEGASQTSSGENVQARVSDHLTTEQTGASPDGSVEVAATVELGMAAPPPPSTELQGRAPTSASTWEGRGTFDAQGVWVPSPAMKRASDGSPVPGKLTVVTTRADHTPRRFHLEGDAVKALGEENE